MVEDNPFDKLAEETWGKNPVPYQKAPYGIQRDSRILLGRPEFVNQNSITPEQRAVLGLNGDQEQLAKLQQINQILPSRMEYLKNRSAKADKVEKEAEDRAFKFNSKQLDNLFTKGNYGLDFDTEVPSEDYAHFIEPKNVGKVAREEYMESTKPESFTSMFGTNEPVANEQELSKAVAEIEDRVDIPEQEKKNIIKDLYNEYYARERERLKNYPTRQRVEAPESLSLPDKIDYNKDFKFNPFLSTRDYTDNSYINYMAQLSPYIGVGLGAATMFNNPFKQKAMMAREEYNNAEEARRKNEEFRYGRSRDEYNDEVNRVKALNDDAWKKAQFQQGQYDIDYSDAVGRYGLEGDLEKLKLEGGIKSAEWDEKRRLEEEAKKAEQFNAARQLLIDENLLLNVPENVKKEVREHNKTVLSLAEKGALKNKTLVDMQNLYEKLKLNVNSIDSSDIGNKSNTKYNAKYKKGVFEKAVDWTGNFLGGLLDSAFVYAGVGDPQAYAARQKFANKGYAINKLNNYLTGNGMYLADMTNKDKWNEYSKLDENFKKALDNVGATYQDIEIGQTLDGKKKYLYVVRNDKFIPIDPYKITSKNAEEGKKNQQSLEGSI